MQYVLLAQHKPDLCPTSNAKVREKVQDMASQIGTLQTKHNVKLLSGPHILGLSHKIVAIVEAPSVEAVRDFGMDAGLVQWNEVEVHQGLGYGRGDKASCRSRADPLVAGNTAQWLRLCGGHSSRIRPPFGKPEYGGGSGPRYRSGPERPA